MLDTEIPTRAVCAEYDRKEPMLWHRSEGESRGAPPFRDAESCECVRFRARELMRLVGSIVCPVRGY